MERSLGLLLVLIVTLAIIHLVQAQSQQGFIYLDCGLSEDEVSPYNELGTGLQYFSDATFIQSGKTGRVKANLKRGFIKSFQTLRYFPEGIRNCYNLKVEKGRKHPIEARFIYGNYDGLNIGPKFDLYLGPNPWATIDLNGLENNSSKEILHIPTSNSLQICLVKTGMTTPLISSLEIRPMANNSYITKSGFLSLHNRVYLSNSSSYIRFPYDVYDRQWDEYFKNEWTPISTIRDVGTPNNNNEPPKNALTSAAMPTNASAPLTLTWGSDNPKDQYYLYEHFAEIQDLQANDTREFNIFLNGYRLYGPLIPSKATTIFSVSPLTCNEGKCSLQLIRTNRSTLPPLLNAFEIYRVIHFPQSVTNEKDVAAVKTIEASYGLSRINWQGDPCFPIQFMWDGLNCSNTDISTPPRITTLNLSSSGLTGTIAAAIQNLTELEKLDLSNNRLIGELPEFLGNIKSLLFINVSGNDLNGSIPQALQKKDLELLVEGNPRLCLSDSCRKQPKKKVLVPIVVSVVSVAIVISVLGIFLVLRKKKSTIVEGTCKRDIRIRMSSSVNATFAKKKSKRFTYSEVLKMTNNLQRVLGKGGFGMVYHGTVNGSERVAVKILSQSSTQGYKEFKAEVSLLLRVHHTNLVRLVNIMVMTTLGEQRSHERKTGEGEGRGGGAAPLGAGGGGGERRGGGRPPPPPHAARQQATTAEKAGGGRGGGGRRGAQSAGGRQQRARGPAGGGRGQPGGRGGTGGGRRRGASRRERKKSGEREGVSGWLGGEVSRGLVNRKVIWIRLGAT
ncbi:putative LRR receptor-like serine/threonine-protein kinase [Cardamine amara subsp. amara]|uniref:non-specific serine/threonine protein kinase n=1 Tax=Cardamine amara subsp. amara TaxID=228776 RepID=A0ABD1BBU3_CARAN